MKKMIVALILASVAVLGAGSLLAPASTSIAELAAGPHFLPSGTELAAGPLILPSGTEGAPELACYASFSTEKLAAG